MHIADVGIYIQMVGIHGRDYGNLGEKLQERTVELIRFGYDSIVFADKKIGVMVLRYAAQKCRTSFFTILEYVGQECARGSLTVCAGYCEASLSLCDLSQCARTLYHSVSLFLHIHKLSHILRNSRSIYYQCILHILRDKVNVILIMNLYTFVFKGKCEFRRCLVISCHLQSLLMIITGDGTHSDAAYTNEIYIAVHYPIIL